MRTRCEDVLSHPLSKIKHLNYCGAVQGVQDGIGKDRKLTNTKASAAASPSSRSSYVQFAKLGQDRDRIREG